MVFKITEAARSQRRWRWLPATGLALGLMGCGTTPGEMTLVKVGEDPTDIPLRAAGEDLVARFLEGDATFDAVYREADGLGPNYIRPSCASCHEGAGKGPGSVQKMSLVEKDGVTPEADQSGLAWGHTARPFFAGGATMPLAPPTGRMDLKQTFRVGIAVFGRGYIEAIDDREIERVEAEQAKRSDGIHGKINRVAFASEANPDQRFHQHKPGDMGLIGRFGHKARIATLDEFAADAAQGDMSITSPMRPAELSNPGGHTDDFKPNVDISIEVINELADYMRLLEMPRRRTPPANGPALFEAALCSACHVPSMKTRADHPFAPLANIDAQIFSDLLLHDMGPTLADGLVDGQATSRQWKTAPLIGLRHFRNFLHDGRALSIDEAIRMHGGDGSEAKQSIERYQSMTEADRATLVDYVSTL